MLANRPPKRGLAMKSGEVIWIEFPASAVVSTMGKLAQADWDQVVARVKLAMELQ
jgi:hypothetical protein